jgi:hypothetical protein
MQWGLALHNSKVPAVPLVLRGCVVAMKYPHALVPQYATSHSFSSLAVMLFAEFL